MSRIQQSVVFEFRMKCKASKSCGQPGLVNESGAKFCHIEVHLWLLVDKSVKFAAQVKDKKFFGVWMTYKFVDACVRQIICRSRNLTKWFNRNHKIRCNDFLRYRV